MNYADAPDAIFFRTTSRLLVTRKSTEEMTAKILIEILQSRSDLLCKISGLELELEFGFDGGDHTLDAGLDLRNRISRNAELRGDFADGTTI